MPVRIEPVGRVIAIAQVVGSPLPDGLIFRRECQRRPILRQKFPLGFCQCRFVAVNELVYFCQ